MARLAIIIGVSNYTRQQNLPASQNDADLVRFVLTSSKAYEEILFLAGTDTNSDEAKHQLTQFVEKHKGRADLEEFFFFYSGHGQFINDEFYYIFSDFDENRRNRTCLNNSELDGYLRTLSPDLAVKIVDACHAGMQYIKDASGFGAIIEKGSKGEGLNKVYFLFSSLSDQSSYASNTISHYTRSFIKAIYTSGRPEIRYRDIVDEITDQFESNREQRPFYVIQADNTEIFGTFQDSVKNEIRKNLEAVSDPIMTDTIDTTMPMKQPTLVDLIKDQARDYLSDTEILETIKHLPTITEAFTPSADILDLFHVKVKTAKDFQGLSGLEGIGEWLNENKKEYFARVVSRAEEYEDYENEWRRIASLASGKSPLKITKIRVRITGYEPTWDTLPFWRIALVLNTKFPNVPTYKLNILYLFSKLDIRLFYSIDEMWPGLENSGALVEYGEWKALQLRFRELKDNSRALDPLFMDFTHLVTENLKKIAGVANEPSLDITDTKEGTSE